MHLCAAQVFVGRNLAGRRLQQRRSGQEDLGLVAHHDDVVGEARQIGAAGRRRAVHHRHLGDAARRHTRLVGEAAAAGNEDLSLVEEVGAAGFDQVHHRQLVLHHDLLDALALALPGGRDGAAFDRRVRRRHDAAHALDIADARDGAAARTRAILVVMHAVAGQRHQFEKGCPTIEQQGDALARHQLLALTKTLTRLFGRRLHARFGVAKLLDGRQHALAVLPELVAVAVDLAFDDGHGSQPPSTLGVLARWKPLKAWDLSVAGRSTDRLASGTPPSMRISVPVM